MRDASPTRSIERMRCRDRRDVNRPACGGLSRTICPTAHLSLVSGCQISCAAASSNHRSTAAYSALSRPLAPFLPLLATSSVIHPRCLRNPQISIQPSSVHICQHLLHAHSPSPSTSIPLESASFGLEPTRSIRSLRLCQLWHFAKSLQLNP